MKRRILTLVLAFALVSSLFSALPALAEEYDSVEFGKTYTGHIPRENATNRYTIVLPQPGRLTISTTILGLSDGTEAPFTTHWYNSAGEVIWTGFRVFAPFSETMDLEPGTYYYENERTVGSNKYGSFNIVFDYIAAATDRTYVHNMRANAPSLYSDLAFTGFLSYQSDTDLYKIELSQAGKLTVNLDYEPVLGLKHLTRLDVYGSTEEHIVRLGGSSHYPSPPFTDSVDLEAGTYYIRALRDTFSSFSGGETGTYIIRATFPSSQNPPSSWAADAVTSAAELGLIPYALRSGYPTPITRADFCALAVKVIEDIQGEKIAERVTFADTADINVEKAAAMGVVSGVGNNRFDPNGKLTREQAAVMLAALAKAVGKPLPEKTATFADNEKISSWAAVQVGQIQAAGIMGGVGNNTFAPKDPYTREQSIITIMKLYNALIL